MRISALVPIYEKPKRAADIARKLSAEASALEPGLRPEILIVVDGPSNTDIEKALAEVRAFPGLRIVEGRPHRGKAEALNRAVAESDADALLLFDNDIDLPSGAAFFSLTAHILEDHDIAELPKIGRGESAMAKIVSYEFLANILASEYLAEKGGRCPSLNGAAFAIRRELFDSLDGFRRVVNEDTDLAARAFLAGARFGFDPAMTVGNDAPESFETWIKQRKRWSINVALWSSTYMAKILKSASDIALPLLFSSLIFPLPLLECAVGALLGILANAILGLGPVWEIILGLAGGAAGFGAAARYYAGRAEIYGAGFDLPSFFAFSFAYLPIWGLASLTGSIIVSTGSLPDLDWKHDEAEDLALIKEAKEEASAFARIKFDLKGKRTKVRPWTPKLGYAALSPRSARKRKLAYNKRSLGLSPLDKKRSPHRRSLH